MNKPQRAELEQELKHAFQQYLMSGEVVGLQISHKISELLWTVFMERFVNWRWDRLYGEKKKSVGQIRKMLKYKG
jgi:hypothetical protein